MHNTVGSWGRQAPCKGPIPALRVRAGRTHRRPATGPMGDPLSPLGGSHGWPCCSGGAGSATRAERRPGRLNQRSAGSCPIAGSCGQPLAGLKPERGQFPSRARLPAIRGKAKDRSTRTDHCRSRNRSAGGMIRHRAGWRCLSRHSQPSEYGEAMGGLPSGDRPLLNPVPESGFGPQPASLPRESANAGTASKRSATRP